MHVYCENAQGTLKRNNNISHATCLQPVATSFFSPHFDVICVLSEYIRTAKWNLFVKFNVPCHSKQCHKFN